LETERPPEAGGLSVFETAIIDLSLGAVEPL